MFNVLVTFLRGLFKIDFAQLDQPYYMWMAGTITLNTISLVIDISDVARYIKGDRTLLVDVT